MSGTHYTLKGDIHRVRVGSIVIDADGYTAEDDAEAELLDGIEHLTGKRPAKTKGAKTPDEVRADEALPPAETPPEPEETT